MSMKIIEEPPQPRSSCCCCCRRPPTKSSSIEVTNKNGTGLTNNEETLPALAIAQPSNSNTFQDQDHEVMIQEDAVEEHKCQKGCVKFIKNSLTFLFSNIGLCSLVVGYSILGGFIFQNLEAPNEIRKRHYVAARRTNYARAMWNLTQTQLIFQELNFTIDAEAILVRFQQELLEAKSHGWDGSDGDAEPQWSFAGSLLYSVTVITTIGYGHIAPKTFEGRLITMVYAIVGIPLTLLCLANIGGVLGNGFRLLYMQICRLATCMCCPAHESYTKSRAKSSLSKSKSSLLAPRSDISPSNSQELDPLKFPLHEVDTNKLRVMKKNSRNSRKSGKSVGSKSVASRTKSLSRSTSGTESEINIIIEDFDQPKTDKKHRIEDVRVPVFVSLMIITIYIFGGALMFAVWEGWDYLEGSYFCFITLSTIGFGDYVPGSISGTESEGSKEKLIICCVYLMLGLAVMAMCFNLMQEDVRAKFVWLGQQIGLVEKKKT